MKKIIYWPAAFVAAMLTLLVMVLTSEMFESNKLFADDSGEIGAKEAPLTLTSDALALNNALINVSNAVKPVVVSIIVDVENENPYGQFSEEFQDFFRFFGDPDQDYKSRGTGSGVIISENGYILTNNHVVENATQNGIKVITTEGKEYSAELIGNDPLTDIAVLKIDAEDLPTAHFDKLENVQVGELVIAVGNPLGLNSTVTSGIISAIGRGGVGPRRSNYAVQNYIQTDAAINPGNSGGGLFNIKGSLIGINTAIATGTGYYMGYGMAIPVDIAKSVALDLIEDGKVDRGYIGVAIKTVDESFAQALGLNKIQGALVENVQKDSPAEKAGIKPEDVILSINGDPVLSSSDLQAKIVSYRAGDEVEIVVWRDGKELTKKVKLEKRKGEDFADISEEESDEADNSKNTPVEFEKLGFSIRPIPQQIKDEYSISHGVIVANVERYSVAHDRGLFPNSVIIKADRKDIKTTGQLKEIINKKEGGDAILLTVRYQDRNIMVALPIPE